MQSTPEEIATTDRGVYVLIHRRTNSLYVGSSKNLYSRRASWRHAIGQNQAPDNFPSNDHSEYEFRVVLPMPNADLDDLRAKEAEVFDRAEAQGIRLLNMSRPLKATTYVIDGVRGTISFHANARGLNPKYVLKRIRHGQTIEQALNLAPKGRQLKPQPNTRPPREVQTRREVTLSLMTVKLLDANGNQITYDEAALITGKNGNTMRKWVEYRKRKNPDLKELHIKP